MVVAIIAIIAAIAIPNLLAAKRASNEIGAVAALKSISTSQRLFRESDAEGDGEFDYGTLAELATAGVIDDILGTGTRSGYQFESDAGFNNRFFVFWAVGNPRQFGRTGDRSFATNHQGVIFYTTEIFNTATVESDALLPDGMLQLR